MCRMLSFVLPVVSRLHLLALQTSSHFDCTQNAPCSPVARRALWQSCRRDCFPARLRAPIHTLLSLSMLLGLSLVKATQAQNLDPNNDTGVHAYETYDGARENINLGSGNVFVSIPLLTLPGRNGLNYSVSLMFNSQSWSPSLGWVNKNLGMVLTRTGDVGFHPTASIVLQNGARCITGYQLTDENGGVHTFSNMRSNCFFPPQPPNINPIPDPNDDVLSEPDDRGEQINADLNGCTLTMKNGTWVPLLNSGNSGCPYVGTIGNSSYPQVLTDPNGNQINLNAFDGTGSSYTPVGGGDLFPTGTDLDTLNRRITYTKNSTTVHTILYEDSSGTQRTITLNVQSFTLSCVFAAPGTNNAQPSGTANVITSAVLPNGLAYVFQYDGCGNLNKIVYPSGGYTRYVFDYAHYTRGYVQGGPITQIELVQKYVCRAAVGAGNTCPVGEDMTVYTPTINSGLCANSANQVQDPLLNTTKYQFTNVQGITCGLFSVVESQRQVYQGSSTLLRTVQTQYGGTYGSYPKGRRTSMCDGSGAASWTHDSMGRVLHERRTIGSVSGDYDNDTYNLNGSVSNITSLT